jgi:molecular chaperone GrpE
MVSEPEHALGSPGAEVPMTNDDEPGQAHEPGQAGNTAAEQVADEPLSLQAQLDEARNLADEQRQKAQTYLDLAQRAQADFQNYKRRKEQELERQVKDANADLLRQVLPVLDDLERALAHVPDELAEHSWAQGVQLIGQKLDRVLAQQGLGRIGAEGELFDPHVHEAVAYEEHPRYDEGQVAGIYRPGYKLHERVLRPAQVIVARASSQPSAVSQQTNPER